MTQQTIDLENILSKYSVDINNEIYTILEKLELGHIPTKEAYDRILSVIVEELKLKQ